MKFYEDRMVLWPSTTKPRGSRFSGSSVHVSAIRPQTVRAYGEIPHRLSWKKWFGLGGEPIGWIATQVHACGRAPTVLASLARNTRPTSPPKRRHRTSCVRQNTPAGFWLYAKMSRPSPRLRRRFRRAPPRARRGRAACGVPQLATKHDGNAQPNAAHDAFFCVRQRRASALVSSREYALPARDVFMGIRHAFSSALRREKRHLARAFYQH
jgi:hypothetical protein